MAELGQIVADAREDDEAIRLVRFAAATGQRIRKGRIVPRAKLRGES